MRNILVFLTLSLCAIPLVAQSDFGFDFRASAHYASDPAYAVGVIGEAYPHAYKNGNSSTITAGWEAVPTTCAGVQSRDRTNADDPRLAGLNANSANSIPRGAQCVFRIDLPTTGNWSISLASGDAKDQQLNSIVFKDGGTPFQTLNKVTTPANNFMDSNGTIWTAATWPASNTSLVHNFKSNRFEIVVGPSVAGGSATSTIAHLRITSGGQLPVVISPSTPQTVTAGSFLQFNANAPVTWSMGPGSLGTIDSQGLYHAPATVTAKQSLGGCQLLPNNHVFNWRIDSIPVNANSAAWIAAAYNGKVNYLPSFPFNYLDDTATTQAMVFNYTPDNNGAYAIPPYPEIKMQGGWFVAPFIGIDRHLFTINPTSCEFQEIYNLYATGENTSCPKCNSQSGVRYSGGDYALAPVTTSAAGVYFMPLSLHLQEVLEALATGGSINHALAFTLSNGVIAKSYIWPATSNAAAWGGGPPYGARFRLKASFNTSTFSAEAQLLLKQLKQYGLILTDGGYPWQVSVDGAKWPPNILKAFNDIAAVLTPTNMEAVDESSLMMSPLSGAVESGGEVVIATNPNTSATAQVQVVLTGITLNLPIEQKYVQAGTAAQQFTAFVNGTSNTGVTWSMNPLVGKLTTEGAYTPPSNVVAAIMTTVTATSVADAKVSAQMNVTVFPAGVIRIINGSATPYTDTAGNVWQASTGDDGGKIYNNGGTFPTVPDIKLYEVNFFGYNDMRFDFTVPNGNYVVTAKFASTQGTAGFDVNSFEVQGQVIHSNIDIFVAAGGHNKPIDYQLPALVTDGHLAFVIRRVSGHNAFLTALEVAPGTGH
jgi:Malectin domain